MSTNIFFHQTSGKVEIVNVDKRPAKLHNLKDSDKLVTEFSLISSHHDRGRGKENGRFERPK